MRSDLEEVLTEDSEENESINNNESTVEFIGDTPPSEEALESDEEYLSEYESVPAIEAMLFAMGEPLSVSRISEITMLSETKVRDAIESIQMAYESEDRGFELVNVGGQFQFRTKEQYARYVRALKAEKPRRLSHAALETLAIIAYRQPIVKADIEKIRGVDATPTLKTLIDRNLVRIVGHKEAVGQPALYGTGEEFLKLFGMSGLSELPTLRELKELDQEQSENAMTVEDYYATRPKGEETEANQADSEEEFDDSEKIISSGSDDGISNENEISAE